MPTGWKAWIVYLLGCAVFIGALHYFLTSFFGLAPIIAILVSIPFGIVTFLIFIWLNADGHFEGWIHKEGKWMGEEPPIPLGMPQPENSNLISQPRKAPDGPWTFFGQFSKSEIDGAVQILADVQIVFKVKEEDWVTGCGWSGPFCLWVRDENVEIASALLVPYFTARERGIS